MNTRNLFLEDSFSSLYQLPITVVHIAQDNQGDYVLLDKTICHPDDQGELTIGAEKTKIIKSLFDQNWWVKHYTEATLSYKSLYKKGTLRIDAGTRKESSLYNTAALWLIGIMTQKLQLPLIPFEYVRERGNAYVEFIRNGNSVKDSTLSLVKDALVQDQALGLKIKTNYLPKSSPSLSNTIRLLGTAPNYLHPEDKVRLISIGDYTPIVCQTGIYLKELNNLHIVPRGIGICNDHIRLYYQCSFGCSQKQLTNRRLLHLS